MAGINTASGKQPAAGSRPPSLSVSPFHRVLPLQYPFIHMVVAVSTSGHLENRVPSYITDSGDGVILRVQVQTRASRDEIVGAHGDALKIRITAAPVAGAANKHLLKFLAKKLRVAKSQISIASGAASKVKSIAIEGISAEKVRQRLTK